MWERTVWYNSESLWHVTASVQKHLKTHSGTRITGVWDTQHKTTLARAEVT
jgi:hypothetical protein